MELKNSHGGYEGKTLTAKLQDELDSVVAFRAEHASKDCSSKDCPEANRLAGYIDGVAWALGLMRSSNMETQRHDSRMRYVAIKNAKEGVLGQ